MSINPIYLADLEPSNYYHVYNRTNNKELLFRCEENKRYFLQQAEHFLSRILDIYGWCLLSNHFHFAIKMKQYEEILSNIKSILPKERSLTEIKFLKGNIPVDILAEKTFSRFFQSYSNSFNNLYRRQGNLFYKSFRRILLEDNEQLKRNLVYIHTNPVKHGICYDFEDYKWSSWNEYINGNPEMGIKKEVLQKFGGKKAFITTHRVHQSFLQLPTLEGWQPFIKK
jgi:REP element-mobilizing transposase RayT